MFKERLKNWGVKAMLAILISTNLAIFSPSMLKIADETSQLSSDTSQEFVAYAATEAEKKKAAAAAKKKAEAEKKKAAAAAKKVEEAKKAADVAEAARKADPANEALIEAAADAQAALVAAETEAGGAGKDFSSKKSSDTNAANAQFLNTAAFLTSLQKFLNRALWPVLMMIGGLLDNDLLFGNGMEEQLREIWIPIRNLVNILFVLVLVGIALYNVLGIGEESGSYSIKTILPQIIVGIIAVNFSFLAMKVVLDGVNVLTASVFALPGQVSESLGTLVKDEPTKEDIKRIDAFCRSTNGLDVSSKDYANLKDRQIRDKQLERVTRTVAYEHNIDGVNPSSNPGRVSALIDVHPDKVELLAERDERYRKLLCHGRGLSTQGTIFLKKYNSSNAAFAMALNMGEIVFYKDLGLDTENIEKILINTLFSVVLYFTYVTAFIAMFIVLLARIVVMWVVVALSPVVILAYASSSLSDKVTQLGELKTQFSKHLLAPLIMAVFMSIGWIMLNALKGNQPQGTLSLDPTLGLPVNGLSSLHDVMVSVGTIAVVWAGVFSAAEGTVAHGIVDSMKQKLVGGAKWLAMKPIKHMPIIPMKVGGTDRVSIGDLGYAVQQKINQQNSPTPAGRKLAKRLTGEPEYATADYLSNNTKVKDKKTLIGALKGIEKDGKLDLADTRKHLELIQGTDFYKKARSEDPAFKEATDAFMSDEKDSSKLKKYLKASSVDAMRHKPDASTKKPTPAPSAAPATPTPPAAPATPVEVELGGRPVKISAENKANLTADFKDNKPTVTNEVDLLIAAAKKYGAKVGVVDVKGIAGDPANFDEVAASQFEGGLEKYLEDKQK
jgi:hypothetical protein